VRELAVPEEGFAGLGREMIERSVGGGINAVFGGRFQALFGISTKICATVWELLLPSLPRRTEPKRLL